MNTAPHQEPVGHISMECLKNDLSTPLTGPIPFSDTDPSSITFCLSQMLATEERLRSLKKQPVIFSPPLITRLGAAAIFRHTINVIQGQMGVHKSRLGSHLASLLLQKHNAEINLLNFEVEQGRSSFVAHLDTERNIREQLPFAIQEIQTNAGYSFEEDPPSFRYASLLEVPRAKRFQVLNAYLQGLRQSTDCHMVIFLDVLTDCVEDFNRVDKSLELIDMLNQMINEHNCTFICIIHENPGQNKARGHLGTELANKASTVIQIAFEKNSDAEDSHILKIRFLKCRGSAKHPPFYAQYSEQERRLVAADERDVNDLQTSRQTMAVEADVVEALESLFEKRTTIPAAELTKFLQTKFNSSEKTIQRRMVDLLENRKMLFTQDKYWVLEKKKNGREIDYFLVPAVEDHA